MEKNRQKMGIIVMQCKENSTHHLLASKIGEDVKGKEHPRERPLEAGKGKETDFLLQPPERSAALSTP